MMLVEMCELQIIKEEINEISESLSEQIKYGLKTTKMEKVWNDDYDAFISNSNRYLNK